MSSTPGHTAACNSLYFSSASGFKPMTVPYRVMKSPKKKSRPRADCPPQIRFALRFHAFFHDRASARFQPPFAIHPGLRTRL
jgi:hypothetical protein